MPPATRRSVAASVTPARALTRRPERAHSAAAPRSGAVMIAPKTVAATYELIADTRALLQTASADPVSHNGHHAGSASNLPEEEQGTLARTPRGTRRSVSFMAAEEQSDLHAAAGPQPRRRTANMNDACVSPRLDTIAGAACSPGRQLQPTVWESPGSTALKPAAPVAKPGAEDPVTVPAASEDSVPKEIGTAMRSSDHAQPLQSPDTAAPASASASTTTAAAANANAAVLAAVNQRSAPSEVLPPVFARLSRDLSRRTSDSRKASQTRPWTRPRGNSMTEVIRNATPTGAAADATILSRRSSQTHGVADTSQEIAPAAVAPSSASEAAGPEGSSAHRPPTPYYFYTTGTGEQAGRPDTTATPAATAAQHGAPVPPPPVEASTPLVSPGNEHADRQTPATAGATARSLSTPHEPAAGIAGRGGGGSGIGRYRPTPGPAEPKGGTYSATGGRVRVCVAAAGSAVHHGKRCDLHPARTPGVLNGLAGIPLL